MVLKSVDFCQFLGDNSDIPFDVRFEVVEEAYDEFSNEKFEVDRKSITAHKIFLSAASPVFKSQFYGKMKSIKKSFEIRNTKINAFELFIQIIYGAENVKLDLYEKFEILDLADYYLIEPIKLMMIDAIKDETNMENLREIAYAALTYIQNEELENKILNNCGKFLQNNLGSTNSIVDFLKNELEMELNLIEKILDLKCANCDYFLCRDGMLATFPETKPLRPGVEVVKGIKLGSQVEFLSCRVGDIILGPVPSNAQRHTRIEGSAMVLNPKDGLERSYPLVLMSNNEKDHWFTPQLQGTNFFSTGGLIFNCSGEHGE